MKSHSLVYSLVALLSITALVQSCGISTHITIARFALDFFDPTYHELYKQITWKHQDAFQAGNPYPDAMYNSNCFKGDFHNIAEDTHWTPFANATAAYIRKTYPQPWDEKTEKLVSFYFGFVSHQIADISWHSLGINQGFLSTMGDIDFFGDFSAAHGVGDVGGDIVSEFEFDLKFISKIGKWYVPIADLLNIYKDFYGYQPINATVLEECTGWLYLGRLGERLAVAKAFQSYSKKSSFLIEQFTSYFLGGLYDMAAWTSIAWNQTTIPMLEHGPQTCDLTYNPLYVTCSNTSTPFTRDLIKEAQERNENPQGCRNRHGLSERLEQVSGSLTLEDIKVSRTEHGVTFQPSDELQKLLDEVDEFMKTTRSPPLDASSAAVFSTSTNHSRLGWELASGDFNNDGIQDLALSAPGAGESNKPQHGRVFIVYGGKDKKFANMDLNTQANLILEGPEVHGRFGSGLAVVDLNKDGVVDLAVSAPSVGTAALTYYGKVYVYFGRANSTLSTTPGMIITGATTYTNLGSTLAGGDLDNDGFADLVVGSPFATTNQGQDQGGIVSIFTSSSIAKQLAIATTTTTTLELSINDAAYTLYGEMQYSWFGYFISVHTIATGSTVLLVGAPTLRVCHNSDCSFSSSDIQSVGKLYAFSPFTSSGSTPLFTLRGSQALSKLGKSATIGFPFGPNGGAHVVVSTPNEDVSGKIEAIPDTLLQAGTVYVLKLSDLLGKNLDINSTNVITSFSGDRRYARFGWSVALTDVNGDGNDDLLVSAPTRTDDFTGEIYGGEEGGIYVYYGGAKFPTGDATKHCGLLGINQPCTSKVASFTVHPSESFSRFGASFIAVDLTGSGQRNVVGGSERSNKGSYLGGTVTVHTQ